MRTFLLLLLLGVNAVSGAPFLCCDPYPVNANSALNPTSFLITGLASNTIQSAALILSDGSAELHYDLVGLPSGKYTVSVVAVNAFGGSSLASAPFLFALGAPIPPSNLHLSPS